MVFGNDFFEDFLNSLSPHINLSRHFKEHKIFRDIL